MPPKSSVPKRGLIPRSKPAADPFARIAAAFAGRAEVGARQSLRVRGKVFAMMVRDKLVVKLPATRVDELIDTGAARPFAMAKRVMKEWAELPAARSWPRLAEEAFAYVGGLARITAASAGRGSR
jgi:hypothetical protein